MMEKEDVVNGDVNKSSRSVFSKQEKMKTSLFLISISIFCNLIDLSHEKSVGQREGTDVADAMSHDKPGIEIPVHSKLGQELKDKNRRVRPDQRGLLGQGSAAVGGLGFILEKVDYSFVQWIGQFLQGFGYTLGSFDFLFEYIPIIGVALG